LIALGLGLGGEVGVGVIVGKGVGVGFAEVGLGDTVEWMSRCRRVSVTALALATFSPAGGSWLSTTQSVRSSGGRVPSTV
jgi:hypothetical protein